MSAAAAGSRRQWPLVVALGITQVVSWGSMYYAFSLLMEPLGAHIGASKAVTVGAFSVALMVCGLLSSPVGSLIDRYGGRWVMTCGSAAGAALLAALAFVQTPLHLYLVWAGIGVAMAATLYDPAFAVLVRSFSDGHRRAITGVTLFGGFASTVFWPLTQTLMERYGWQAALWSLALINLLVCVPLHAWAVPGDTRRAAVARGVAPEQRNALGALLRDPSFYWLCAAFTGNALVFSAMSVHFIPVLQGKGLTIAQAAWVGALIGPMQVLGRILEFTFLARAPASRVGAVAMWLLPASLYLLFAADAKIGWLLLFAALYGAGNGIMTIVRGSVPAELYGREFYGAVNGAMATPVLIAKAAGPTVAALVLLAFTGTGSLVLFLAGVAAASAALFSLTSSRTGRRAATVETPQARSER